MGIEYLDEKYDALEQKKTKEKKETPADDFYKLTREGEQKYGKGSEFYKQAEQIAGSLIGKLNASDPTNASENKYQRHKMENAYKHTSFDEIKKRELHHQWIRENFDARTGDKLPTWISEEEFLKQIENGKRK